MLLAKHTFAFVFGSALLNLSLKIPPINDEINPRTEQVMAFVSENSSSSSGQFFEKKMGQQNAMAYPPNKRKEPAITTFRQVEFENISLDADKNLSIVPSFSIISCVEDCSSTQLTCSYYPRDGSLIPTMTTMAATKPINPVIIQLPRQPDVSINRIESEETACPMYILDVKIL